MTVRGYQLGVDWSGQGSYANAYEDVSSYVNLSDLTVTWGRDLKAAGLNTIAGSLDFELVNNDRVFSPENTSSPLNGKVLPGRGVRWQKTLLGTIYTLFAGTLDDLDADPNSGEKTFTGNALDAWGRPGAETLSTPLYRGLRTGDAINVVLDQIGWTGPRDIDPGATFIAWWWEEGTDAATAVNKLVNSEGPPAMAYVEGGTFVFRDRHHRLLDTRSQVSQATFTHVIPAGTGPAGQLKIERNTFGYNHGLKNVINSVDFAVRMRAPAAFGEVWTSDDPITVAAGQTLDVNVQPTDPFFGAVTPTAGVDYDLQSGVVSISLTRDSGQSTTVRIVCSSDAVITRLALRAFSVPVTRTVQIDAEDVSSVGTYGRQTWPGDPVWANPYDAQAIADRIVAVYAVNRPTVTFTVAALDDTYLTAMLRTKIGDRVTIRNDELGLNADFIVERISHTVVQLGVIHRLEIGCVTPEPVQPANAFTFDVAGKGFNDGAFGVDGISNPAQMFRFDTTGVGFDQGLLAY